MKLSEELKHWGYQEMAKKAALLEEELAEYKEHFEPQMIDIRLHDKAVAEQRKTYKTQGE